jgi:hypothetical protein
MEAPEGSEKVPTMFTIIFSRLNLCRNFLEICARCVLSR